MIPCIIGALLGVALLAFLIIFGCFLLVFYSPKRKKFGEDEFDFPKGEIYEPHYGQMTEWTKNVRTLPHEDMFVTSRDGLTLRGRYYECKAGAPIEILFNGYRGNSERDLCGSVERCFAIGRNALLVDQRASGASDGSIITFGVKERFDCLVWVDKVLERFGDDTRIILTGISMGAATVMMAAGEKLPKNVVCILADCGYSSAENIIKKVIRQIHLPVCILYPVIKLGARLFGGFDLEESPPIETMKKCNIPVIFVHGEADDYVPCDMSRELYEVCASPKKLVTVPGAGHGLAFPVGMEDYLAPLREFEKEVGFNKPLDSESPQR